MANILVTGGAGYVGAHCVKALAAQGHSCVVFDNLLRGHAEFVRWGPLVRGDVRDAAALAQLFSAHRFDAVLHCAARAEVPLSIQDPEIFHDINVNGTRTLLSAMRDAGIDKLVFSSTCSVYGELTQVPVTESAPCRPINPYGETKLQCEAMMDESRRDWGLESVRLRYFNAAGADAGGEIGEDHTPETHLVPRILDVAMGRRPEVAVFGDDFQTPDGTAVRDFIHVTDLARAHATAMRQLLDGGGSLAVNLGTGVGASVNEVIAAARTATGHALPARHHPRRLGDPATLVADASLAGKVLAWKPEFDLRRIMADAWRWHQQRFAGRPAAAEG